MSSSTGLYGDRTPNAREQRCIALVAAGLTNKDVSRHMRTSECAIKNLLRSIYDKLGMWSRVELALWYERRKWEKRHAKDHANVSALPLI